MEAKGRRGGDLRCPPEKKARGIKQHCAKLTEEAVREIRISHAKGASLKYLARAYKVSDPAIKKVVIRETWAHIID